MLFGAIGAGYFLYGKKQAKPLPLAVGIGLCIYPYFMPGPTVLVIVGIVLMALPWLASRYF
ncbi:MAG: hypothetical protein K8F27_02795 [Sulfuricellaceae bacterium]|nr:hypothetical protein [Sulfuricellaceae bacterium]